MDGKLPNRLNYVLWIEKLLQSCPKSCHPTKAAVASGSDQTSDVHGIDIGTGASCIYALLGAAKNQWHFLATEIDQESYDCACANVQRNAHLQPLIRVIKTSTTQLLEEPLSEHAGEGAPSNNNHLYHFVMCNPPFFETWAEASPNPSNCCMGNDHEMLFPEGDFGFIKLLVQQSQMYSDRVVWFTSLVGRKQTLRKILALLRSIDQVRVTQTTEFIQGVTRRWGIAWSFWDGIAVKKLPKHSKVLGKRKEARRRQDMTFVIPWATFSDAKGTSRDEPEPSDRYMAATLQRIESFVSNHEPLVLCQAHSEENGSRSKRMFTLQQTKHGEASGAAQTLRDEDQGAEEDADDENGPFRGNLVLNQQEEQRQVEVTLTFASGTRRDFWCFCDQLKASTLQTARAWRRKEAKRLKTSTDDVVPTS